MTRRRVRLKYCGRCGQRTKPSAEDRDRCDGCFNPYGDVIPLPAYRLTLRRDDDTPDEAA
jgi:hypothetical protein